MKEAHHSAPIQKKHFPTRTISPPLTTCIIGNQNKRTNRRARNKMNSPRCGLPPSLLVLVCACVAYLALVQAFSTVNFSSRRIIGWQSTSTTNVLYGMFQDEDCEDLCDAFGEELPPASLHQVEEKKVTTVTKPNESYTTTPPGPRRSRALWWSDSGLDKCKPCNGSGEETCRFCGGTTFLSGIGGETDALFYEGIGKECPVCKDGVEVCHKCAGTGYMFVWSKSMNHTASLHP